MVQHRPQACAASISMQAKGFWIVSIYPELAKWSGTLLDGQNQFLPSSSTAILKLLLVSFLLGAANRGTIVKVLKLLNPGDRTTNPCIMLLERYKSSQIPGQSSNHSSPTNTYTATYFPFQYHSWVEFFIFQHISIIFLLPEYYESNQRVNSMVRVVATTVPLNIHPDTRISSPRS